MNDTVRKGLNDLLSSRRAQGRTPSLGRRELAVLESLWDNGAQSAQSVRDGMRSNPIGLSTVQSTLERLHRKRLVRRTKRGRAYVYAARLERSELIRGLLHDIAAELAGGDPAPMISGFMDYLADSGETPFNPAPREEDAE